MLLLKQPWRHALADLLRSARTDVLVASPFVTRRGVDFLGEHLPPAFRAEGRLRFLTDLSARHVVGGATDPDALRGLADVAADVRVHHLPRLHAKVYLADATAAVVTSGNLTEGGLRLNHEYGVSLKGRADVAAVRSDVEAYAELGTPLSLEHLSAYSAAAGVARATYGEQQRAATRAARRAFEEALERADVELLRLRVAGDSVQAVLARTVLYLLGREGPLSTAELHPLVQALHPDLCDDAVERVIDGQRFGKRWKHWVRSAQAGLKRDGLIALSDGRWRLA